MIARYPERVGDKATEARPAFEVFLASQQGSGVPMAIFRQTEHAALAGELARGLRPEIFGALPPEALEAVAEHDWGWGESDDEQLEQIRERDPLPFPRLGAGGDLPSWERSMQFADGRPLLTRVMIRRHFCALANTPMVGHAEFQRRERAITEQLERELAVDAETLKRWTDALGFCDLVSLYLSCGTRAAAEFPLAHPAEPYATEAKKVVARWRGEEIEVSEPVFAKGTRVRAEMLRLDKESRRVTAEKVEWGVG